MSERSSRESFPDRQGDQGEIEETSAPPRLAHVEARPHRLLELLEVRRDLLVRVELLEHADDDAAERFEELPVGAGEFPSFDVVAHVEDADDRAPVLERRQMNERVP